MRLPWQKSWSNIEDPLVPLERNLHGHPFAGPLWKRQLEKILMELGWGKVTELGMSFFSSKNKDYSCRYTLGLKNRWKEAEYGTHVKEIEEKR